MNYEHKANKLIEMSNSEGRKIMQEEIQNKINHIEEDILQNIEATNNEVKFTYYDQRRAERLHLIDMLDMPNNLINDFKYNYKLGEDVTKIVLD